MNTSLSLILAFCSAVLAIAGLFMAAHGVEPAFRVAGYIVTLAGIAFCIELARRNS